MADNGLSAEDAASQRAAEQARLRKERREAKIRAGGSARLNRITGLGGGVEKAPANIPNTPGMDTISQEDLTRLMLGIDRPGEGTESPPDPLGCSPSDPFAAMMQQMLAGGGLNGAGNPFAQMAPGMQPAPAQPASKASSIWRILHALFAISLGLYVALSTPFRGTKEERELIVADAVSEESKRFFWIFASVEAMLLTTRFFVDGGRYTPTGILGMVMGFLPPRRRDILGP
ncbi:unnamed protein product [Parascedosporium putredinis]|uniref:GET complex, subunit GET2 n=1 Tax=Parascedosporium putredinis TaxID=1442378 RepID=A0A9P1GZ24_9PEZI|nr:unnamed protein product [Parascedosporium putredinis]CAI7990465.1 unnamed protein product [Parascedosporium putredinis]